MLLSVAASLPEACTIAGIAQDANQRGPFNFVRTGGKHYQISEGDGLFYS
jgi:hypothetical protein